MSLVVVAVLTLYMKGTVQIGLLSGTLVDQSNPYISFSSYCILLGVLAISILHKSTCSFVLLLWVLCYLKVNSFHTVCRVFILSDGIVDINASAYYVYLHAIMPYGDTNMIIACEAVSGRFR